MPPDPDQDTVPAVPVPIEEVLDLHPFHPRDIPSVVEEYLREAAARGFQEVRLIHGRGIGFQRQVVQDLLARHPLVLRFADAPPHPRRPAFLTPHSRAAHSRCIGRDHGLLAAKPPKRITARPKDTGSMVHRTAPGNTGNPFPA